MSVDDVFENTFDTLESLCARKQAVSEPEKYEALYTVYRAEDGRLTEDQLGPVDLTQLLDTNLLARIPKPDGTATVRITTLGRHEIEADLRHLNPSLQENVRPLSQGPRGDNWPKY